jgi:hypothetical protein
MEKQVSTEVMIPVVVKVDEITIRLGPAIRLGPVPVLTITGHILMPDGHPASRLTVSVPVRTEHLLAVTAELNGHFAQAVAEMFGAAHLDRQFQPLRENRERPSRPDSDDDGYPD